MKLDEETVRGLTWEITYALASKKDFRSKADVIQEVLKSVDLVHKPGDSSQSVLANSRDQ